jgi:hypothetical protein
MQWLEWQDGFFIDDGPRLEYRPSRRITGLLPCDMSIINALKQNGNNAIGVVLQG